MIINLDCLKLSPLRGFAILRYFFPIIMSALQAFNVPYPFLTCVAILKKEIVGRVSEQFIIPGMKPM
jgi:hypothetical protein